MQDKIIAAIAAYLEKEIRPQFSGRTEYGSYEFNSRGATSRDLMPRFCHEIAAEIVSTIAPLVDAREPELNREKYNKSFLYWLDKYFYHEKSMGYRSNTTGVFFTVKELEQRYERANLDKARL